DTINKPHGMSKISLVYIIISLSIGANCEIPPIGSMGKLESPIIDWRSNPNKSTTTNNSTEAETIQMVNWVMPAKEVPMILPNINWNGFTEDMMTSIILLVFSSMTLRMTNPP